jgi:molybdate transport system permease protein
VSFFDVLSPGELEALKLSLRVASWNLIVGLPLAIAVAWLLARCSFPGKELLNGLVHLPLILPPVVTGYILLILLGRRGPLGELLENLFGIVVAFRWTGAVIAATVMSFPVMVRPIRLSLEAIDQRLEAAAGTLGASPLAVFATVTLPLALPGIVAGGILGFAKGKGEFGATITFVSNIPGETQSLPLAIYTLIQIPGRELGAIRLTLIAVAVSLAALLAAELLGRSLARRIAA